MAHRFDDGEVVANEDERQTPIALQVEKQIQNLRLNRNVERRDGFVANQQVRTGDQGAGNVQTLPLTAGEFVRIAGEKGEGQAGRVEGLIHALPPFIAGPAVCA